LDEIGVEAGDQPRCERPPLSHKEKAAALFRALHGVREMLKQAERLDDKELVHFLAVAQLLIEDRTRSIGEPLLAPAPDAGEASHPN
jgi:hypothetical protein